MSHLNLSPAEFISRCQQSSDSAYQLFKRLLLDLENVSNRKQAFLLLMEIKQLCKKQQPKGVHFQFLQQQILDSKEQCLNLDLIQFPSTFLPEAWSFTFYEGLLRYPYDEFKNKKIVELGCGIGWISIAMALRYSPKAVYGLDINPKATVCAKLNLYLNSLNSDGSLKLLAHGKTLLDCVHFKESNLFSCIKEQSLRFDRIIGCIPQVLNPEPEVMETLIAETASDEYLHSLSNYFAKQGFIEDQFGLGLIALAVEQSIPLLESNGKLILNLGGRPGRSVLERLMQRRGFNVRRVWQTQVEQATDTEIDTLVDIEKNTGHRFEFYMSANSDIPIDARVASEYAKAGGKIYHSVDVYEATMLFPDQVKSIYRSVDDLGSDSVRSAVDLTYDNIEDAEERYFFLAYLAKTLAKIKHFPYQSTAGLHYFRQQLAEFFSYYLRLKTSEQQLIITPSRREMLNNLLACYRPKLVLIAKSLWELVSKRFDDSDTQLMQTPLRVEHLIELIKRLKPQLVVTQLDEYEIQSTQLVEQLIKTACEYQVLLILDLTDSIDLSSQPKIHGIFRYLSERNLPDNLVMMAGLVNNRVYQNYSLNITLSGNPQVIKHLEDAAELTYSRTPSLKQFYYGHLLEQLLYFQRTRAADTQFSNNIYSKNVEPKSGEDGQTKRLCHSAEKAFSHPAILGNRLNFTDKSVRLDYGENELDSPEILKEYLLESYLVRNWAGDETSVDEPIRKLLLKRFSIPTGIYSKIILGDGVAPIFSAILSLCHDQNRTLIIPTGSYGYFNAAAEFKQVSVFNLQTSEENQFKVTVENLKQNLETIKGGWLFLNAPIVNPTGAIYSNEELNEILNFAIENEISVALDTIFSGLEFTSQYEWDLASSVAKFSDSKQSELVLMGGLSKEFAAGGLRFGYAWTSSKVVANCLQLELPQKPHFTLCYSVRKLINAQLAEGTELVEHLSKQRAILADRASMLSQQLESLGWQVIRPQGGLFLVAKPSEQNKPNNSSIVEYADQAAGQLFNEQDIVINNATWTGLPGYCRFVLSGSEADFLEAVKRLEGIES
jgi:methionine S-methyltransferase